MPRSDQERINSIFANIGRALEAYELQLRVGLSPFDRFAQELATRGRSNHLSAAAQRGLRAFLGEAACINCHNGSHLSDGGFHNLGLPHLERDSPPDPGHSAGARDLLRSPFREDRRHGTNAEDPDLRFFRNDPADGRGSFKTPSLRNVAQTAPYGHAGQMADLTEMLAFYTRRDVRPATGRRDGALVPLDAHLVPDLVAFLESLTGTLPAPRWLASPREYAPRPSGGPE